MNTELESFLFGEDLTPDEVNLLREALAQREGLADSVERWQALRQGVRASMDRLLPDRSLLVLLALHDAGRQWALTEAEQALLAEARPELEAALRTHPALERVMGRVLAECDAFSETWDATQAPALPARRRASDRSAVAHARRREGLRWTTRLVLGFSIVAFAVIALFLLKRDQNMVAVTAPAGTVRQIALADGSTVRLMGGSTLSYPDPSGNAVFGRHVRLEGDAFFDVAPQERVFTVETRQARATVLGTRFGVRAGADVTEVTLASGRVSLAPRKAPDQIVVLDPGEMSRVGATSSPSEPVAVDLNDALRWTGEFFIVDMPLGQVAQMLSKQYDVPIAVHDVLVDEPVTATGFARNDSLRTILDALAATLRAQVKTTADGGLVIGPLREE